MKVRLDRVSRTAMLGARHHTETSAVIAARVQESRDRAARRLSGSPWQANAEVPGAELRKSFGLSREGAALLDQATERGQVSGRGADKIAGLAWTLADLAGKPRPTADELNEAIGLWLGVPG